jgi:hypothetical protein
MIWMVFLNVFILQSNGFLNVFILHPDGLFKRHDTPSGWGLNVMAPDELVNRCAASKVTAAHQHKSNPSIANGAQKFATHSRSEVITIRSEFEEHHV